MCIQTPDSHRHVARWATTNSYLAASGLPKSNHCCAINWHLLGSCLPLSRKKSTWGSQHGTSHYQSYQLPRPQCLEQRKPGASLDGNAGALKQEGMEHSPCSHRAGSAPEDRLMVPAGVGGQEHSLVTLLTSWPPQPSPGAPGAAPGGYHSLIL